MRIVFVLLALWALRCTVSSSLPSPVSVTFSSVNLRNILQWRPGNDTPGDTRFTVQYAIYGDSVVDSRGRRGYWRALEHCTGMSRRWCDLSSETWDLEHRYYARVRAVSGRASSKWSSAKRFDPKLDTTFSPPLVSVETKDNSAIVTLTGPMRYEPNNHTPAVSMATLYPQMMYNLSIHDKGRDRVDHFTVVSRQYKYRLMDYNTEYCFSAKSKFLSMPVQCQPSEWHCMTTPPDPAIGQLQKLVVGITVSSVCLCTLLVAGYLLYQYLMGEGQKSPHILNLPSFNLPPLTFPPEKPNLILITLIEPADVQKRLSDPTSLMQWPHTANPPPGRVPQRADVPPEPAGPWDDISVEYGFVSEAPNSDEEEEERESRPDRREGGLHLEGEHQKWLPSDRFEGKEQKVEDGRRHTETIPTQFHSCSKANSLPPTQSEAPLLSFKSENNERDGEFPGLFMNKSPQTGVLHIRLDLQMKLGEGVREEMDRKVRVKADGGVEEGSERERMPLLSAYASQNIDMLSDFLPDDCGVLRLATPNKVEKDDDDDEQEEEEGPTIIDWDPMTRKLVLPELDMEFNKEARFGRLKQAERGRENRLGGEEEVKLTLESVFVRQASEEEAQRERETDGEAADVLAKWDLVISMSQ